MDMKLTDRDGDFATLEIALREDDSFSVVRDAFGTKIKLPLYTHEADEMIATLEPLAKEEQ